LVYDALKRHSAIKKLVTRVSNQGLERKYYRFRCARWYGRIVTADCVGCGLLCRFCLVSNKVLYHPAVGHTSVMASFSTRENMQLFMEKLAEISPKLAEDLEIEELILYSHVKESTSINCNITRVTIQTMCLQNKYNKFYKLKI
jgi:uncharacterized Fe-S cluster-containing radical SAM superfamily protein